MYSEVQAAAANQRARSYVLGFGTLLAIGLVGLFIVKWQPYYARAFAVAANHTLGPSIVSGQQAVPPPPSLDAAVGYAVDYFKAIWQAMALGLLLAATVDALLPRDWLARVLGRPTLGGTVLGGIVSLPGMMCSCCATPVALSLRKKGMSMGGALAFWIGNPALNPAVLVFMLFALSWKWALLRAVVGIILVVAVPWMVMRLFDSAGRREVPVEAVIAEEGEPRGGALRRWFGSLFGLTVRLVPEYLVIVLALGAARAWLFPAVSPEVGQSVLLMVGLAIAGTLFVIPTAGEIPIVQTLMGFGLGAGPAGVLLTTLAPVSLPSLVMMGQAFPARVLAAVAGMVAVVGLLSGAAAILLGF